LGRQDNSHEVIHCKLEEGRVTVRRTFACSEKKREAEEREPKRREEGGLDLVIRVQRSEELRCLVMDYFERTNVALKKGA